MYILYILCRIVILQAYIRIKSRIYYVYDKQSDELRSLCLINLDSILHFDFFLYCISLCRFLNGERTKDLFCRKRFPIVDSIMVLIASRISATRRNREEKCARNKQNNRWRRLFVCWDAIALWLQEIRSSFISFDSRTIYEGDED